MECCTDQHAETLKQSVRSTYSQLAIANDKGIESGNPKSCCGASVEVDTDYSLQLGYSKNDVQNVPKGANMGLGCGNPQAIAELKEGETILDLGSGGGFDAFLAARKVGTAGKVIGVDMTPEMIQKSRNNAQKGGFSNVEFRLGEIECVPVQDASVDVIISNCVINLSPAKKRVFAEAFRVLKSGGRLALSDIIATQTLPDEIKQDLALYSGCIAGAISIDQLKLYLQEAGFQSIEVQVKEESRTYIKNWASESGAENYVASAYIKAVKP
jgi:arsenite methyltransferase